tara:strand:+ start:224 stop:631 length:408 start_codon:yes stop_codon:yes gene_type:complete
MPDTTTIQITEEVTQLSVTNDNGISVTLIDDPTVLTVNNFAIPVQFMDSGNVSFDGHGTITADNVRDALQQLADQDFRTAETPTGSNIEEGDTWYDTDDNQLKVYRETSSGVFEWVPIMVGNISDDSDTLDAGAF